MTDPQAPIRPRMPIKETIRLGKEIYKREILPQVKDDHFGEYVAIDVETGEWEMAETEMDAVDRLQERRIGAMDIMTERIGFRAPVSFGGAILEESE